MNRNACLDYRTSRPKNGSYMTPDDFKRYFAACRRVSDKPRPFEPERFLSKNREYAA